MHFREGLAITFVVVSCFIGWIIPYIAKNRENYYNAIKKIDRLIVPLSLREALIRGCIAFIMLVINSYFAVNILSFHQNIRDIVLLFLTFMLISGYLLFISIYDIYFFEIPDKSTTLFLIVIFLFNLVLLLVNGTHFSIHIFNDSYFVPWFNMLSGLVYGGIIFLIVVITSGKGMGAGDIWISAMVGLLIGANVIISFYATIFSGLIVGLMVGVRKGKFRGVAVPFVPFIIFGGTIGFIFSSNIIHIVQNILLFTHLYY